NERRHPLPLSVEPVMSFRHCYASHFCHSVQTVYPVMLATITPIGTYMFAPDQSAEHCSPVCAFRGARPARRKPPLGFSWEGGFSAKTLNEKRVTTATTGPVTKSRFAA